MREDWKNRPAIGISKLECSGTRSRASQFWKNKWYSHEEKEPTSLTTRAACPGSLGWMPWEDRLCRTTLVRCGVVRLDRRRPSSGLDLALPRQLRRLCGLCETGVISLFLTDIEKDRFLAYKESGLSNKHCARRLGRGVHCVRRWWRRYQESSEEGMAERKSTGRARCTSAEEVVAIVTVSNIYVTMH